MTETDVIAWSVAGGLLLLAGALHLREWLRKRKHRARVAQLRPQTPVVDLTGRRRA